MADVIRNCTNCGNSQLTGAYCATCGTRLPDTGAVPYALATQPDQPGDYPQIIYVQIPGDSHQYASPHKQGTLGRLFDTSFQGFVTRGSLRTLYVTTLVLLGVYWLFTFIFSIVAAVKAGGWWSLGIFSSIALVAVIVLWTRIMMELTMTISRLHENSEKTTQGQTAEVKAKGSAAAGTKTTARSTNRTTSSTGAKSRSAKSTSTR